MAGKIFTVAQQKGGAGKTTLAAHLAVAWTQAGYSVATLDIDPQGSLSGWHAERTRVMGGKPDIAHVQITGWRTQKEVERLVREYQVVVIDSPPHAETEARIAVRAARLVITPIQPSPMDLWATRPTLELAKQEKVPVMLVLNRVPPRAKVADLLAAKIAEMGTPPAVNLAQTRIGNRIAYAGALLEGRAVTETEVGERAGEEMAALAAEIMKLASS
ncbi:ParA family protein [Azospirillaceae bacterium]